MSGNFQDDWMTAAPDIADVDPGCVRLPRPQVVQRPPGGGVGGVVDQLGQLGVLTVRNCLSLLSSQLSQLSHLVELQHKDVAESVEDVEVEALHHHWGRSQVSHLALLGSVGCV